MIESRKVPDNQKVLVLGANGMLGSNVLFNLALNGFSVQGTTRNGNPVLNLQTLKLSELGYLDLKSIVDLVKPDYIVNCIGTIKQKMNVRETESSVDAIRTNSIFPSTLNRISKERSIRVIQIATDCVFSGEHGGYNEASTFDAQDLYGQSKIAGELASENLLQLRCSIIGHEQESKHSLLNWFYDQPVGASVPGFLNHKWNGITAHAFSQLIAGIVGTGRFFAGTIHVVPRDTVSKFELLCYLRSILQREDLYVDPVTHGLNIDRTLSTLFPKVNIELWAGANYTQIPTIFELIERMEHENAK
jgi:dTDP-4-dehydrorhamnose reductase